MNTTNQAPPAFFWAFFAVYFLFIITLSLAMLAGQWKTFKKAGQPGWAAIIPIYNIYVTTKIARRPGWWTALTFVPLLGILVLVLISIDVADAFDMPPMFGVGLGLLPSVFYCLLGFGKPEFRGTSDHRHTGIVGSFSSLSPPRSPGGSPPPGWYDHPDGELRWWDGTVWGPPARS